ERHPLPQLEGPREPVTAHLPRFGQLADRRHVRLEADELVVHERRARAARERRHELRTEARPFRGARGAGAARFRLGVGPWGGARGGSRSGRGVRPPAWRSWRRVRLVMRFLLHLRTSDGGAPAPRRPAARYYVICAPRTVGPQPHGVLQRATTTRWDRARHEGRRR